MQMPPKLSHLGKLVCSDDGPWRCVLLFLVVTVNYVIGSHAWYIIENYVWDIIDSYALLPITDSYAWVFWL